MKARFEDFYRLLADRKAHALLIYVTAATILHPWNRELCREKDIVSAEDWPGLARALDRILQAV